MANDPVNNVTSSLESIFGVSSSNDGHCHCHCNK